MKMYTGVSLCKQCLRSEIDIQIHLKKTSETRFAKEIVWKSHICSRCANTPVMTDYEAFSRNIANRSKQL